MFIPLWEYYYSIQYNNNRFQKINKQVNFLLIMMDNIVGISRITMVIVAIILIIVAGVAIYVTTSKSIHPVTSSSTAVTPFKIAIISAYPSDSYFAEYTLAGLEQAASALNTSQRPIIVTPLYNVPQSSIISTTQTLAQQGYKFIILYIDYISQYVEIAKANPGVLFADEYAIPNGFNLSTYNFRDPESNTYTYNASNMVGWIPDLNGAYYVAGVAAALITHSGKIGFVAAFNIPVLATWYNNFANGVHSVNKSIQVYYAFSNDWSDPTKGAAAADSLISLGCDVIATAGDTQSIGAAEEATRKGVFAIGYPFNVNNISAQYMLGSVYFNATALMYTMIQDALNNNLEHHFYTLDMAHHGEAFLLNPYLVSNGIITQSMLNRIKEAEQLVINYTYTPTFNGTFPPISS